MPEDARPRLVRQTRLESLEDRVVMSADPLGGLLGGAITHHDFDENPAQVSGNAVGGPLATPPPLVQHGDLADPGPGQQPDFWRDPIDDHAYLDGLREVQQTLASAHDNSGLSAARERYGLRGSGQTVAVIDSGIAYDHYALGSGLGQGYRVVGGYDFTEGDADPYDDGPEGGHGTHVAGIVGADGSETGVAPDVDLVGLRVFDDAGAGFFSWVEQALDWVHENRNAFENPITTVNLSLGTNFNGTTTPAWANLEDEFAQLVEDGIFISVSAGNSFGSFGEPGLSYPAVSPHVVPVISADDSGDISFFSQRLPRGIVAPGRAITSTVPDYQGNNNGVADDYRAKSGTSMAAPYVAGAAVLVREAMEFAGRTNITQEDIYDHLVATADTLFDSVTGLNYNQLNIEAALDALLPEDDFGSSVVDAFDLGTIRPDSEVGAASAQSTVSGLIGQVSDSDYFTFTAGATGTVTFAATNATHYLDATFEGFGGEGWSDADGSYTFNVVAGQEYTVALSSLAGIGYYDLSVSAESTFTFTDWGAVAGQSTTGGVNFGSAAWYRVQAGQGGLLTADLLNATGQAGFELYDASLNLVDDGADGRLDVTASAGEEFYLRLEGDGSADVRLTNLVSVNGSTVDVSGTAADDTLTFTAGDTTHTVSVNGVEYTFDAAIHDTFNLDGGVGSDTVTLTGTGGDETAVLRVGEVSLVGDGFTALALSKNVSVIGGGGSDRAFLYDTSGDDRFVGRSDRASLSGDGFRNEVFGFGDTRAYASGGSDRAFLYDSTGDDRFVGRSDRASLSGEGFRNEAFGFGITRAYASAGSDRAFLYDSLGDDTFVGRAERSFLSGDGFRNEVFGFGITRGYSSGGNDRASLYDSSGDDTFVGRAERSFFSGDGFRNEVFGFGDTRAYASGGSDRAFLYDSSGDDVLSLAADNATLNSPSSSNSAAGFSSVEAVSSIGGNDTISAEAIDFAFSQIGGWE